MEEEITIGEYVCVAEEYITDWIRNGIQDGFAESMVNKPDSIDAEDDREWYLLDDDTLEIRVSGQMFKVVGDSEGHWVGDDESINGSYEMTLHVPLQKIYELVHKEDVLDIEGYDQPDFSYEEMVEWCKNNL